MGAVIWINDWRGMKLKLTNLSSILGEVYIRKWFWINVIPKVNQKMLEFLLQSLILVSCVCTR